MLLLSQKKSVDACVSLASDKFVQYAQDYRCNIKAGTEMKVVAIDNRTLNPFKYLMWEMEMACGEEGKVEQVTKVTQYVSYEKKCW